VNSKWLIVNSKSRFSLTPGRRRALTAARTPSLNVYRLTIDTRHAL
jgi:hypothetical protein